MKYRVNQNYRSGLGGPWKAGDFIDLDVALAERINVDSPGTLSTEQELIELPESDRMVKQPSGRRHTVANEGAIDGETFKAVKDKKR